MIDVSGGKCDRDTVAAEVVVRVGLDAALGLYVGALTEMMCAAERNFFNNFAGH